MKNLVRITATTAMLLSLTVTVYAAGHRDLVLVSGLTRREVPALSRELGIVVNGPRADGWEVEATADQQAALLARSLSVKLVTPDIDLVYEANSRTFSEDAWYMPYATYRDTIYTIVQNNPSFIKLETLAYSVSNRLVLALKFSDNPHLNENEPEVHFEANIHGDEKISWGVLMEMVKYLAGNYGSDSLVTRLINTREIWLVPLVNPDGYENATRYNGNWVDLNRNWGWMWQNGSSRGSGPMSEPESKGTVAHIMRHPFTIYVSYHAGTEFISYPWSYTYSYINTIPERDLIHFLSSRYDSYTHYTYGQGADSMYYINGSTKDFNYGYDGSMGWSIEVHFTKTPPASEIEPTFNENRGAILEFFHRAGQGINGTVTDALSEQPVHAQVIVNPAGWHSFTDAALGDFHRFYLPGTYDVTFRAPGYRDTTVSGVVVPNSGDSAVTVNVALRADSAAPLFGFRVMYTYYISSPSSNRTYPVYALGPQDGIHYQLDAGRYICIDMDRLVLDRAGDDLVVYRNGGSGSATVKGCLTWDGTYATIGTAGSDETSFDLDAVGLDSIRFLRIEASGTFNLDAVEGTNYTGIASPRLPLSPVPLAITPIGNPSVGAVRFALNRPVAGGSIAIYDKSGREVRTIAATGITATWNGLDRSGRRAPDGVYFASVDGVMNPVRFLLAR